VFEPLEITSHRGPYKVIFEDDVIGMIGEREPAEAHFVIDKKVAELYGPELGEILTGRPTLLIEATEANKSLDKFTVYVEQLLKGGLKRSHILVAVGGGIIQDITCFLAATMFRGMDWRFYPTKLLAQSDSCIGSKSSINVGGTKNILGTFTPPRQVTVCLRFLSTLAETEVRSGIGEMLKVHVIDGPSSFDNIAADYNELFTNSGIMMRYVRRSLEIKKVLVEKDEFDRGPRNIMNYGHSFGHALESATDFLIPHGIAVSLGMDMANYVAVRLNLMDRHEFERMHVVLATNYRGFEDIKVPLDEFFHALTRDKKNVDARLNLILPDSSARVHKGSYDLDDKFRSICSDYFAGERK
jgi:3-dehydroquinate synthase